jgi:hypothetical protein
MLEYDASQTMRLEIVETALTAIFETLPKGHAARAKLIELLQEKLDHVGFATERRHELERVIAHLTQKFASQDLDP